MADSPSSAVTIAAAAIVDIWMGGDTAWRSRLEDSDFLESADWQGAVQLAQAALDTMQQGHLVEALKRLIEATEGYLTAIGPEATVRYGAEQDALALFCATAEAKEALAVSTGEGLSRSSLPGGEG
jgi:hypothetical protein